MVVWPEGVCMRVETGLGEPDASEGKRHSEPKESAGPQTGGRSGRLLLEPPTGGAGPGLRGKAGPALPARKMPKGSSE